MGADGRSGSGRPGATRCVRPAQRQRFVLARARKPSGHHGEPGRGELAASSTHTGLEDQRCPTGSGEWRGAAGNGGGGGSSAQCGNIRIGGAQNNAVRWKRQCALCRGQPTAAAGGSACTVRARCAPELPAAVSVGAKRSLVAQGPGSVNGPGAMARDRECPHKQGILFHQQTMISGTCKTSYPGPSPPLLPTPDPPQGRGAGA